MLIGGQGNIVSGLAGACINSQDGCINSSSMCTMIGGQMNVFDGGASYSVMSGGLQNTALGFDSFIGGGNLDVNKSGQSGMLGGHQVTLYSEAQYAASGGCDTRGTLQPAIFLSP